MTAAAPAAYRNRITGSGEEDPEQLAANPRNFRIHSHEQEAALRGVLAEVGWVQNVLVNRRTGFVIDGHLRVAHAISSHQPTVPVVYVDLDPSEEAKVLATLDPLAAMAGTDQDQLAALLAEVATDDAGLQSLLDTLSPPAPKQLGEDTADLTPPAEPITRPGDLWRLGDHRMLCGDSTNLTDVERLMDGKRAAMLFTDPPYGVAYVGGVSHGPEYAARREQDGMRLESDDLSESALQGLLTAAFGNAFTVSQPGAVWYVAAPPGPLHLIFGRVLHDLGVWRQTINWVKSAFVFGRSDYHYRHEPIFYGWVEGAAHYFCDDHTQDTVWEFPRPVGVDNPGHPTAKPVALIERCLTNSTRRGDLVLDLFGGSGSTLVAAETLDRTAYLMEIDPRYCDVIIRRYETLTGRKAERDG